VILRRTRLGLLDGKSLSAPGSEGAERVARALAGELGWDDQRYDDELDRWRAVALEEGLAGDAAVTPATNGVPDVAPQVIAQPGAAPEEAA
jgi:glycerol-3-phosphate dehydrogenase